MTEQPMTDRQALAAFAALAMAGASCLLIACTAGGALAPMIAPAPSYIMDKPKPAVAASREASTACASLGGQLIVEDHSYRCRPIRRRN